MLKPALPSLDARTSLTLSTPDARTLARCSNQPYPLDASLDARNRALDISSALLIQVRVPASSSNRDVALNLYRKYSRLFLNFEFKKGSMDRNKKEVNHSPPNISYVLGRHSYMHK